MRARPSAPAALLSAWSLTRSAATHARGAMTTDLSSMQNPPVVNGMSAGSKGDHHDPEGNFGDRW